MNHQRATRGGAPVVVLDEAGSAFATPAPRFAAIVTKHLEMVRRTTFLSGRIRGQH